MPSHEESSLISCNPLFVEAETKNLNLQVTLLVQKGVGTPFPRVLTPLHPCPRAKSGPLRHFFRPAKLPLRPTNTFCQ